MIDFTLQPVLPSLVINPAALSRSVYRGGNPVYINAQISNTGLGDGHNLRVVLPTLPWINLVSNLKSITLQAGTSLNITLALNPTANNSALAAYVGDIVVAVDEQSVLLPFSFLVVSSLIGSLRVEGMLCKIAYQSFQLSTNSPSLLLELLLLLALKLFSTMLQILLLQMPPRISLEQ